MDRAPLRRSRRGDVPRVDRPREGAWLEAALVDWLSSRWRRGAHFESRRFSRFPPHTAVNLGHVPRLSLTSISTRSLKKHNSPRTPVASWSGSG